MGKNRVFLVLFTHFIFDNLVLNDPFASQGKISSIIIMFWRSYCKLFGYEQWGGGGGGWEEVQFSLHVAVPSPWGKGTGYK